MSKVNSSVNSHNHNNYKKYANLAIVEDGPPPSQVSSLTASRVSRHFFVKQSYIQSWLSFYYCYMNAGRA